MAAGQVDQMVALIVRDLDERSVDYELLDGAVDVGDAQLGFTNLAGVLLDIPEAQWPTVIAEHFDLVLVIREQEVPDSWEEARLSLRVRMKGTDEVEAFQFAPSLRDEVAEGLWNVVVYDLPESTVVVTSEKLDQWGVDAAEVRQIALSNTLAEVVPESVTTEDAGFTINTVTGSFYAGTLVNDVSALGDLDPGVGAVVAVPMGDTLLIHPITSQRVLANIASLALMTQAWHADGPGSASPEIYWVRDNKISRLDLKIGDQGGRLRDLEFMEMVGQLPTG